MLALSTCFGCNLCAEGCEALDHCLGLRIELNKAFLLLNLLEREFGQDQRILGLLQLIFRQKSFGAAMLRLQASVLMRVRSSAV